MKTASTVVWFFLRCASASKPLTKNRNRINRLLRRVNIIKVFLSTPFKDKPTNELGERFTGLGVPGVYRIACSFGKSYISQTGCTIEVCGKEHQRHLQLGQEDKSTLTAHEWETGHYIVF